MAAALNETLLEDKLAALEKARPWSPRLVSRIESLIRNADDEALLHVNPLLFAAEKNFPETEVVDLFLYATKLGLFEMEWHLLCPHCSQYVDSFATLRHVQSHYHCVTCHRDGTAALDDYIQVSFTIAPQVRRLKYHDPGTLPVRDFIFRLKWSQGAKFTGGPAFFDCASQLARVVSYLEPGECREFEFEVGPGFVSGSDIAGRAEFVFMVEGDPSPDVQRQRVALDEQKADPAEGRLAPGRCVLEIENRGRTRAALLALAVPEEIIKRGPMPLEFPPFLSGKRLLMSQTFRDILSSETIKGTTGLGVKSVAMLFTDLKGSTELYERIGDLQAFALVQQHFDRLGKVVREHAGAMVKTIGDAVMASFMTPADAVGAAIAMLREIDAFNQEHERRDVILKIGVHSGSSIAVTLNERLDYFGQTINIAARVQGLADADEIYVTDDVYQAPGVKEILGGFRVQSREAYLKGIRRGMQVYRVTFDRPALAAS